MKICLFSSYYEQSVIPNYVIYYLKKLEPHFDEIYLITNQRTILNRESLDNLNVFLVFVENRGYDFGMYYNFLSQNLNILDRIEHIALINDSCICFKDLSDIFEHILNSKSDYCGLTDSIESNYHIQSFFLYFKNKKIIKDLIDYMLRNGIVENYNNVIRVYETGLARHLKYLGYNADSVYSYMNFLDYDRKNIVLYFAKELILRDCPLIKKKVLLGKFRNYEKYFLGKNGFDFSMDYFSLIKKNRKQEDVDFLLEKHFKNFSE